VVAATILTTAVQRSPELLLFRNLALLVATIDAAMAMILMIRRRPAAGATALRQGGRTDRQRRDGEVLKGD
jgi:hypothetical protein